MLGLRGISYDKLGLWEKAIADFSTVLRLDPNNVNAFFNRGSAHDSLGQYEEAVADYSRALDLDSSVGGPGIGTTPLQTDPVFPFGTTNLTYFEWNISQFRALGFILDPVKKLLWQLWLEHEAALSLQIVNVTFYKHSCSK